MICTRCEAEIVGEVFYAYEDADLPVCPACSDQYESICPVCGEVYPLCGPFEPEWCDSCAEAFGQMTIEELAGEVLRLRTAC